MNSEMPAMVGLKGKTLAMTEYEQWFHPSTQFCSREDDLGGSFFPVSHCIYRLSKWVHFFSFDLSKKFLEWNGLKDTEIYKIVDLAVRTGGKYDIGKHSGFHPDIPKVTFYYFVISDSP